jgi:hypothetical protein
VDPFGEQPANLHLQLPIKENGPVTFKEASKNAGARKEKL